MDNKILKFSDEVIAQIAKALQIALLTGTDIVDNLRQLSMYESDNTLYLNEEFKKQFENNLESLLEEINERQE